ncbi:glycosyltransferase [Pedobacter sp. HMF7647]|uniref:Glycosyltransferase n=1 Tax=Hufsiella arboris TaxID=2695275 RepID=A0A7K1YCD3_9SPHI|nr:glycosyltransferase [Hufsiella arboris]MXV51708.1 glycosyltransferase [Hufsiella arboris]
MENIKPNISVALAVYNGEPFLVELLDSLNRQILKPCELIIIDDASTDKSLEIIQQIALDDISVKVIQNDVNLGPVKTFKKLLNNCRGEFIAFCDQDDIWMPNKLLRCYEELIKLPSTRPSLVFSDLKVINDFGNITEQSFWKRLRLKPEKSSFKDVLIINVVTGCATMINGRMSDELKVMPDKVIMHDHWLALIGYSFGTHKIIREQTIFYREHEKSVTSKSSKSFLQRIKINFTHFFVDKRYLQANLEQAKLFSEFYESEISYKDNLDLKSFLKLTPQNTLQKKMFVFISKMKLAFR